MGDSSSVDKLKPARMRFRFILAYITTFVVLLSYFKLSLKGRFFSEERQEEHRAATNRRNARRVQQTILSLQGLFIKVGQLFSIMTNILPEEFRSGLKQLQDAMPARPYCQIERRIVEELGGTPSEIFLSFNENPIASASLGQVHEAVTRDGLRVAVKVQHLGVRAMAKTDLVTIRRIIGIVKFFLKTRGLDNFYQEIRSMILEELDFAFEAKHIESIAENFANDKSLVFPRVVKELSTSRVLTMEYVEGFKITDSDAMKEAAINPEEIATRLITVYCQMIFVDGLYHADPHPGNVLIQKTGRIVLLDFGAVGRLSEKMRNGVSSFLQAIIKADEAQLLASLETMGFLRTGTNQSEAAARVIEYFHRRFQDEIKIENFSLSSFKIDTKKGFESLADIRKMDIGIRELSSAFHIPKEWVLLERALLLLAGICTHLSPDLNPASIIQPYLEEFVIGKDKDWSEMLFDMLQEKLMSVIALPAMVEKTLNRSLAGQISFQVTGLTSGVERVYAAGHQLIFTLLSIASAGVALYFYDHGEMDHTKWAGYTALTFGAFLFLSILKARRYRSRR
jgi:predicted unusual protein kinase regulating ubiquinone biosynthesis (AarF/ABC1/UbiB family)